MTFKLCLSIAGSQFELTTPSQELFSQLDHILSGFKIDAPPGHPKNHFKIQLNQDKTVQVIGSAESPTNYATADDFIAEFEWQLIRIAIDKTTQVGIHSGAVVRNGQTLLFPGHSGSGKSTLTLASLLLGGHYLTDEISLISSGGLVSPFPRVLCLKNGTDLFNKWDKANRLQNPSNIRAIRGATCVTPHIFDHLKVNDKRPVDLVIFPNFRADAATQLSEISRIEAFNKLLSLTFNRSKATNLLETLGTVVENAPCYELTMSKLEPAIHEIQSLLG